MKVELNNEGRFTLSAENEVDNTLLFSIVNGVKYNGVSYTFPQTKSVSLKDKLFGSLLRDRERASERMHEAQAEMQVEVVKPKRKYTKRTVVEEVAKPTKKRRPYTKTCPVAGCDHKAKSMPLHLRMAHGVQPDGSLKETWVYNGATRQGLKEPKEMPVKAPVVKLPDGTYKVRPTKGLLD